MSSSNSRISEFYLEFESQFRGSSKNIDEKMNAYNSLLETILKNSTTNPNVLDIGCGRGEWLVKCKNFGFDCVGIEQNENMVLSSRKLSLNIVKNDALTYLKTIPDKSISLVTSFHVIEHLTSDYLLKLIPEIFRVLREDGLCLLETPSIDNLIVSSRGFYLDPTHITRINPDGIQFILKQAGFDQALYFLIHGGPLMDASPKKLTRVFNGVAQDLLVIASKSSKSTETYFAESSDWIKSLPLALSTLEAAVSYDEANINSEMRLGLTLSQMKNDLYRLKQENENIRSLYRKFRENKLLLCLKNILKALTYTYKDFKFYYSKLYVVKYIFKTYLLIPFHLLLTKILIFINRLLYKIVDFMGLNRVKLMLDRKYQYLSNLITYPSIKNNSFLDGDNDTRIGRLRMDQFQYKQSIRYIYNDLKRKIKDF